MKNLTQILSHSTTILMIWVFILLFPLLFIWQGGDLTDTGYHVSVYHFFFDRLSEGITDSLIFLTEIIGGSWMYMFPFLGVLGVKLLAVLFFYVNIYLSWRIIIEVLPKNPLTPFFILCAVAFIIRGFPIIFNYDVLTSFFLILILFLLRKKEHSLHYKNFLILGIISALMMFTRFPNIFILLLFPMALLIAKSTKLILLSYRKYFQLILIYFLGFLLGCIVFLIFLQALGWYDAFSSNFIDFSLITSGNNNSYNVGYVLQKYLYDIMYFLYYFFIISILFVAVKYALQRWNKIFIVSSLLFITLCILSLNPLILNYNNVIKYVVPSLILITFLAFKTNKKTAYIALLLFFFAIIQIAGSNTGIFLKISLLSILAFPLAMTHLSFRLGSNYSALPISLGIYTLIISSLIHTVFIYGIGVNTKIRLKATHNLNSSKYIGIRTTQQQADKINSIDKAMQDFNDTQQKLFVYGHQPMLYYLTDHQPALKEFWLTGNNLTSLEDLLIELSNLEDLPIFIDTNENIFSVESEQAKNRFLRNHNYKLVKSIDSYDIWKVKY